MVNKGQKEQVTEFYIQVRKFYQTFASKLLGYLPLKNAFLRTVRVLEPKNFADMTLETSLILLSDLCRLFPTILDDCTKDSISREWRTLKLKEVRVGFLAHSIIRYLWIYLHKYVYCTCCFIPFSKLLILFSSLLDFKGRFRLECCSVLEISKKRFSESMDIGDRSSVYSTWQCIDRACFQHPSRHVVKQESQVSVFG